MFNLLLQFGIELTYPESVTIMVGLNGLIQQLFGVVITQIGKLTLTLSASPLSCHMGLKSIFWETLFLDHLHDFSLFYLNSFLHPFLKSNFMKKNFLTATKKLIVEGRFSWINLYLNK